MYMWETILLQPNATDQKLCCSWVCIIIDISQSESEKYRKTNLDSINAQYLAKKERKQKFKKYQVPCKLTKMWNYKNDTEIYSD